MATIKVLNMQGKEVKDLELSDELFGAKISEGAVHQAVVNILANKRQGTKSSKTRTEVRGGGRKPWRQKGRGAARQGSIRSPQWRGGGVIFAPKPRDFSYKIPKSMKKAALRSVLTAKYNDGKIKVIDQIKFDAPKTQAMGEFLKAINANRALVVTEIVDRNVYLSGRNIPKTEVTFADVINVYDLLKHDNIVVSEAAIQRIQEVFI